MKAAMITGIDRIELTTIPDPTPRPRDVVIQVVATGICGTDLHILEGEFAPSLPVVPGHEFAGRVVEIGADVTEVAVGDAVAVDPSLYCFECYYCQRGQANLCERWNAIGITEPGGAAEFARAPVGNCFKLPDGLDVATAALVEPLACAVRGFDVLPLKLGTNYLIYGAGTMGLMMMELAKRAGAIDVSVVDLNPARLETARLLGCTAAVTSSAEVERARGWDVVIDCTGVPAAIEDGLRQVGRGGTFLQFGVSGEHALASFEPFKVYNREITITGSMAILNSFERARDLFVAGAIRPDVMISESFALDEYADAVKQFRAGVGRKLIITPN
ncbi:zinc-dependent alcohol dehydrogenase family protein [Kribbella sp. NBC_01245]|uniref:zinc-dependent alcohol dehydrogenase family protein n=1 Tax=Kribbella sp. NBC_01245 TaxID=2903578 RepID=UPI002E2DE3E6|nr:zinc-dependent alcohol dehydrogenase family protein [Kribbella sp. NBC_01245]